MNRPQKRSSRRLLRGDEAVMAVSGRLAELLAHVSMARAQIIVDQWTTTLRTGQLDRLVAVALMDDTPGLADADPSNPDQTPIAAAAVAVAEPEAGTATMMFAVAQPHVFPSQVQDTSADSARHLAVTEIAEELNAFLDEEFSQRGLTFIQWATDPIGADSESDSLPTRMRFTELGTLQYLAMTLASEPFDESEPETFSPALLSPVAWNDDAGDFTALVERTYDGSLDCPAFVDFRSAGDLLHSYRTSPNFCDAGWFWVVDTGHRVGVLVMSMHGSEAKKDVSTKQVGDGPVNGGPVAELTYMGVDPGHRGRGLGRRVLAEAIRWSIRDRCGRMIVAADVRNEPALSLYKSRGFEPILRETVWGRNVING